VDLVFAVSSGQFHQDMTTYVYLSGLSPSRQLDNDPTTPCNLPGLAKTKTNILIYWNYKIKYVYLYLIKYLNILK